MPNGIIIIDKPHGWTSMDVCAKLRGIFHEKRVGHGGTLDPMATGVLPVFVGRATRAVEFAETADKEYVAGLRLGLVTTTQDTSGEVLEEHPVQIGREQVEAALEKFRGNILQIPPMYSAIRIGGKKLYELARRGKEVERPARPVTIHSLTLEGMDGPADFTLRVRCSKGTYVRTLCHDIGQVLGCGGCMSSLRRTMAAGFTLEDAVTLDAVQAAADRGETASLLMGVDRFFLRNGCTQRVVVPPDVEKRLRNGSGVTCPCPLGEHLIYSESGEFLGYGKGWANVTGCHIQMIKSFFEV